MVDFFRNDFFILIRFDICDFSIIYAELCILS